MLPVMYEMNNQHFEKRFWIQCESCKLYLDTNEQTFQTILFHFPGHIAGSTNWTCNSCKEKASLILQLGSMEDTIICLNNTIIALNKRVESLQVMNTLEKELDESINNLTSQFCSLNLNHSDKTIPSNIDNVGAQIPPVAAIVDVSWGGDDTANKVMSSINNDTSVWTISDTHCSDNVIADDEQSDGEYTLEAANSSFGTVESGLDRPIKTLFFGDSVLRDVNLLGGLGNKNEYLKIPRNNASLIDLVDTIYFFLEEVLVNNTISTVILQTCTKDIRFGQTESMMQTFEELILKMEEKGISLIIIGPLPFPSLGSHAFSRACCINDWLEKHTAVSKNTTFVDIFHHFWKKQNLFGRKLNLSISGQIDLATIITEKYPICKVNSR